MRARLLVIAAAACAALGDGGTYVLSDANIAWTFQGIGGISGGGATSRLLYDYPEPQRSSIMNLLFTPQWMLAIQQFKTEVPGDADTTCGSEQSHQHDASDVVGTDRFRRGYEGWMLSNARERSPSILTSALQWAAPRLVADPAIGGGESLFTPADMQYVLDWLAGTATAWNMSFNAFSASWNEHPHNSSYIKAMRAALDAAGGQLAGITLQAPDEWDPSHVWTIVSEMGADPALLAAVNTIGTHVAGVLEHGDPTPDAAIALHHPIVQSEEHFGLPDPDPVPCWEWASAGSVGIEINQNYVLNNMSGTVYWPIAYSWGSGLPYRGKGFVTATSPWGADPVGYICPGLWVAAHTTHFTAPNSWSLLNGTGSGHITGTDAAGQPVTGWNVSYVTYVNTQSDDILSPMTLVVESMFEGPYHSSHNATQQPQAGAPAPITATFQLAGGLAGWAGRSLNVWHTNQTVTFVQETPITIGTDGSFQLTIEPAAIYTLTTVSSSHPGARAAVAAAGGHLAMLMPATPADPEPHILRPVPTAGAAAGAVEWVRTPLPRTLGDRDGPNDDPWPLPYADDFEGYRNDTLPLYLSDMFGAFATYNYSSGSVAGGAGAQAPPLPLRLHADAAVRAAVVCAGESAAAARPDRCSRATVSASELLAAAAAGSGGVLRQAVSQPPIGWGGDSSNMATILGLFSWTDIALNISVSFDRIGDGSESVYVGLRGGNGQQGGTSPGAFYAAAPQGYTWRLLANGTYTVANEGKVLQSGVLSSGKWAPGAWHSLQFIAKGAPNSVTVAGTVDGVPAFTVVDTSKNARASGYAFLGTGCNTAMFDNLYVAAA